jgi:carbamoyltransferase
VANGKIVRKGIYENVYVQPAAGDAGGALGAALLAWHQHFDEERVIPDEMDGMAGSYLGPSYDDRDTRVSLEKCGAKFSEHSYEEKIDKASDFLVQGKSVGWFHGKMEFGPRALGGRSILADPRSQTMQKDLNLKVKFRESFRPFAPSVLAEFVDKWFDFEQASPYMLFVADVKEDKLVEVAEEGSGLFGIDLLNQIRSLIPAVTHVDNSARIQTVHEETNKAYYDLLKAFHAKTGCPIVVNTSFNVRGEPIVCTPEDAFRCFMGTDLDVLVCGNFILEKDSQELSLAEDYQNKYKLD